jgi:hypothetical protein
MIRSVLSAEQADAGGRVWQVLAAETARDSAELGG